MSRSFSENPAHAKSNCEFFLTCEISGAKKATCAKKLASGLFESHVNSSKEARMDEQEAAYENTLTA
jgi:hypothetical protein